MDPQVAYYQKHGPTKYRRTAQLVDLCMTISERGCSGDGCDEGIPCRRHRLAPAVAERYLRILESR